MYWGHPLFDSSRDQDTYASRSSRVETIIRSRLQLFNIIFYALHRLSPPSPEDRCHSIWKKSYSGLLLRQRPCPLGCRQTSPGIPQRTMQNTANGPPMPTVATYHQTPACPRSAIHDETICHSCAQNGNIQAMGRYKIEIQHLLSTSWGRIDDFLFL